MYPDGFTLYVTLLTWFSNFEHSFFCPWQTLFFSLGMKFCCIVPNYKLQILIVRQRGCCHLYYCFHMNTPDVCVRRNTGRDVKRVGTPALYSVFRPIHACVQGVVPITEAISRLPLTAKAQVQSQTSPYEICVRQVTMRQGFLRACTFLQSVSFHPCSTFIHEFIR